MICKSICVFCLENSKKDDERAGKKGMLPWDAFLSFLPFYLVEYIIRQVLPIFRTILQDGVRS